MLKPGFIVSGIFHLAIFMLPVATRVRMDAKPEVAAVELFIMDAAPGVKKKPAVLSPPEEKRDAGKKKEHLVIPARHETEAEKIMISPFKPEIPDTGGEAIMSRERLAAKNGEKAKSPVIATTPGELQEEGENFAPPGIPMPPMPPAPVKDIDYFPPETAFGTTGGPDFLHREMPEYPRQALRLGKEATVLLMLTIDERGKLAGIRIVEEAGYGFTEAAIRAVKKSTFTPAKKEGNPVASRALLPVSFKLRR